MAKPPQPEPEPEQPEPEQPEPEQPEPEQPPRPPMDNNSVIQTMQINIRRLAQERQKLDRELMEIDRQIKDMADVIDKLAIQDPARQQQQET